MTALRAVLDALARVPTGGIGKRGSRFAGEGDAGDLLEVVEEAEGVPIGEEGGEGVALVVTEFEGEEAVGFERGAGLGDEAAVDVEAIGAGKESGGGFVVADLGVQGRAVGGGDVGWVGDNGVEMDRAVSASPPIAAR